MGKSKYQKHQTVVCACGCGESFEAFPTYKSKYTTKTPENYTAVQTPNTILYLSKYKRGHHPSSTINQVGNKPAWNKGLKKADHPSISKMGFQPGHKPYNDWSHVIDMQRNDPIYREKWLAAKKGQTPWNKGLTAKDYPNGTSTGKDHGNWCGGKRGAYDTAKMKKIKLAILKRDAYTCQECGDKNHKGRGSRVRLEVHHIIAIAEDHTLAYTLKNLITLCHSCHVKTDNYGTKVVNKIRKQSGN